MTQGIYCLKFNGTTKVYIGQSNDIESRFIRHIRSMYHKCNSIKLNEAYNLYGKPSLEILEEVEDKEFLDITENFYIDKFNSYLDGYNSYSTSRGTNSVSGELHYNSKYTTKQFIECMFLLLDPDNTINYISSETGVPNGSINVFARGRSHTYIKDQYPKEYALMLSLIGQRRGVAQNSKNRDKNLPSFISPNGKIYQNIPNLAEFCRIHSLDITTMQKLKSGKRKTNLGWRTYKP